MVKSMSAERRSCSPRRRVRTHAGLGPGVDDQRRQKDADNVARPHGDEGIDRAVDAFGGGVEAGETRHREEHQRDAGGTLARGVGT